MSECPGLCIHCRSQVIVEAQGEPDRQRRIPCPYCDAEDGVVVLDGLEMAKDLAPSE